MTSNLPSKVVVHPLVLLSTVDHYNRIAKDTSKRVVGVLLGEVHKGVVDVTNSYAGINWVVIWNPKSSQFHSRKMNRTAKFGFWITIITKTCMECLGK